MSKRSLVIVGGLLAFMVLLVTGCASMQIREAQRQREHLGEFLYTETKGSGADAVVFLPGLTGSTSYWTSATIDPPATKRLLFVDLLGFGRSPWPNVDYTLDDQIGALRRTLVRHRATEHIVLVGHSFGSIIAAHYAARFPGEVDRLILFGTPMYRDRRDAAVHLRGMSGLAALLVRSPVAAHIVCTLHNALLPLAARMAPKIRPDLPPMIAHDGVLHFWPSLNGSVQHVILREPLHDALRVVGGKTTIVFGTNDVVSDRRHVEEIARKTGATLVLTDDTHASYWKSWPRFVLAGDNDRPSDDESNLKP